MSEQPSTRAANAALVLGIIGWVAFFGTYGSAVNGDLGDALYYQPITILAPVILPLLTIVFGHVGLSRAEARERYRRRSTTALVLGYLLITIEVARFVGAAASH